MDNIFKTLVEIPTVSGDALAVNPAIEYVDRFLSERGMHVKRFDFNSIESIVATTQKTKKPKLLLAAHIDVVPAPMEQFVLREVKDRFYGRGAFDMKFAIAAYLQLIDDLNGSLKDYDIGLMITSDEEIGGHDGTESLLKAGYGADIVILPDAGDTPENWKLEIAAKGAFIAEIRSYGKAAHGSRPWKGENAIDKLTAILDDVRKLFKDQGPDTNTLTISTIIGGMAQNQVPESASAQLDIRTLNEAEKAKMKGRLSEICSKFDAEMDILLDWKSIHCDVENPLIAEFISCVKDVTGKGPSHLISTGASDARYFVPAGIPCIIASPPGDGYHASEEWVSKEGLYQLKDVLRMYADKVAKVSTEKSSKTIGKRSRKTPQLA